MESEKTSKRGRPVSYERDWCLRRAMLLFWRHGYEGTSIATLTKSLEIAPPSLYAAFGDKKSLFLEAIDLYLATIFPAVAELEKARTAKIAVERLLRLASNVYTRNGLGENGCLLMTGAISVSQEHQQVQDELRKRRVALRKVIVRRINADQMKKRLPPAPDALLLSGFYMMTLEGMSTMGRDGMHKEDLIAMAELAMLAWPAT